MYERGPLTSDTTLSDSLPHCFSQRDTPMVLSLCASLACLCLFCLPTAPMYLTMPSLFSHFYSTQHVLLVYTHSPLSYFPLLNVYTHHTTNRMKATLEGCSA